MGSNFSALTSASVLANPGAPHAAVIAPQEAPFFPGLGFLPFISGLGGGFTPPVAQPGPQPTPQAAPTRDPAALILALQGLPIAMEGQPILPGYHNALRTAVIALAGFVDPAAVDLAASSAFVPALHPVGDAQTWVPDVGAAVQPETNEAVDLVGWMPLRLPEGLNLTALSVLGRRAEGPAITSLTVSLLRRRAVPEASSAATSLLDLATLTITGDEDGPLKAVGTVTLTGTGTQFEATVPVTAPGITDGTDTEIADQRTKARVVRSAEFAYLARVSLKAAAGAKVRIETIRVETSPF